MIGLRKAIYGKAEGGFGPLRKVVNNGRRTTKFHMKVYHDVNYILGSFMTSSLKTRFSGVRFVGYNFRPNRETKLKRFWKPQIMPFLTIYKLWVFRGTYCFRPKIAKNEPFFDKISPTAHINQMIKLYG